MAIIYGDNGNNLLKGTIENDTIYGLAGNDQLSSTNFSGNDLLIGGLGNDHYSVDSLNDRIIEKVNEGSGEWVYSSADTYVLPLNGEGMILRAQAFAGLGNDLANTLEGSLQANLLHGRGGIDVIYGFGGDDQIYGDDGNDVLYGGLGKDVLYGGTGRDRFSFESSNSADSPVGAGRDVIRDFNHYDGDKINVSSIDADLTLPGDQAFTQGSYVDGILTADVIGGDDIQIELTGAPYLDLDYDIIL